MPKTHSGTAPEFHISETNKEAMIRQLVPQTVFALERLADVENAPLADDFVDLFARAAAVMLAADTNLDTSQKQRLGAETVAAHVLRHLKRYVAEQEQEGQTVFHQLLAGYDIPEELRRAWQDS